MNESTMKTVQYFPKNLNFIKSDKEILYFHQKKKSKMSKKKKKNHKKMSKMSKEYKKLN